MLCADLSCFGAGIAHGYWAPSHIEDTTEGCGISVSSDMPMCVFVCECVNVCLCAFLHTHTHMCTYMSLQGSEMVFCLKLIFKPFEFMLNAPQISAGVSANSSDLYLWVCQC